MAVPGPEVYFSLGAAVYIAVKPLVKIYLSIAIGYFMWKVGIITPAAQKGISAMILNVFMPCLIFYNVVQSIKDTDIGLVAVIWLTGFIFYAAGLGYGLLLRLVSPIPRGWFGGLIFACMLNNVNDLPVAYVQTLGGAQQIPSAQEPNGTAYSVMFTMVFTLITFNCGGTRLVAWDFNRKDPHRNEATVPPFSPDVWLRWAKRLIHRDHGKKTQKEDTPSTLSFDNNGHTEKTNSASSENDNDQSHVHSDEDRVASTSSPDENNSTTRDARDLGDNNSSAEAAPTVSVDDAASNHSEELPPPSGAIEKQKQPSKFVQKWRNFRDKNWVTGVICHFIEDLRNPQMIALLSSIAVAMVPWAKRVFRDDPTQVIHGWHDPPDGNPPLDSLMNFFSFMAGASVPLGLMMLGATMARLKLGKVVPGFRRTVFLVALWKLALLPIIACGWIARIRLTGWDKTSNLMLPVVIAVTSGTPSATVQVYLTLSHINPDQPESLELNCIALLMITQYIIMPLPMGILVTYVLKHFV